jgi:hypothetical protein
MTPTSDHTSSSATRRGDSPTHDGTNALHLDVYGLRLLIDGDWPDIADELRRDFAWFEHEPPVDAPDVVISIQRRAPESERFGELPQAFITTRNAVFQCGSQTVVDYFGRVLSVYDRDRDQLLVQGEDHHLVHEAAYLFVLSRVGRHLDQSGLTRIHALGLSGGNGAVLLLLPSGGGKTTLALRALREPSVKLVSEDTPLLDRHGLVHPFPLRIGVNVGDEHLLPPGPVGRIERFEYGPKLVLSLDAFRDRIEERPQPLRHVVVGERSLGREGSLSPLPRRALVGPLLRDAVVGVGVAQMVEYVLERGSRDLLKQGRLAAARSRCCVPALFAQGWKLRLGRDPERNWAEVAQLLR